MFNKYIKKNSRVSILLPVLAFFFSIQSNLYSKSHPISELYRSFDIDVNSLYLPAFVQLINKKDHQSELAVDSREWSLIYKLLGMPGKFQDFEFGPISAREFMDIEGKNQRLDQFKKAEKEYSSKVWQGPAWDALREILSNQTLYSHYSEISARGHSRKNLEEFYQYLIEKKYTKHMPLSERLYNVSSPESKFHNLKIPQAKEQAIIEILADIETHLKAGEIALWEFFDDDYKNILAAKNYVLKSKVDGKYKSIQVALHFTGYNNPEQKSHSVLFYEKCNPCVYDESQLWDYYKNHLSPNLQNKLQSKFFFTKKRAAEAVSY